MLMPDSHTPSYAVCMSMLKDWTTNNCLHIHTHVYAHTRYADKASCGHCYTLSPLLHTTHISPSAECFVRRVLVGSI